MPPLPLHSPAVVVADPVPASVAARLHGLQLRPLGPQDVPDLLAVQAACYGPGLLEGEAVFLRRLAGPAHCSLALTQADGTLVAYLAAYRSVAGKVTPLHGDFEPVPQADTLYLHDMAVRPDHGRRGLAQALVAAACERAQAEGLRGSALVSVQGSQRYWERQGYAVRPLACAVQQQRLAGYGEGAVYMARGWHASTPVCY